MATLGKRVVDDLYVHISIIDRIEDLELVSRIREVAHRLALREELVPNVAKVNLRSGHLSLLLYADFEEQAFPTLMASWTFAPNETEKATFRDYRASLNPPILHRKELLVADDHPLRAKWALLTQSAEAIGLFDDISTIGFALNWQKLIALKGYCLDDQGFRPLANDEAPSGDARSLGDGPIQRHLTALHRSSLSAPVQLLLRHGLLAQNRTLFDFGCGRGGDLATLRSEGFDVNGWDPHYASGDKLIVSDVVNLGFVINVIEDPAERIEALISAFNLARGVLAVGVMLNGSNPAGRPYRDGYLTSINTFQKYFSQSELKAYLEQVLDQEAFMVGPGVAFVFSDKALEQRFSAGRYRTRSVVQRLLAQRPRRTPTAPRHVQTGRVQQPRLPKLTPAQLKLAQLRPQLDVIWTLALDLGRYPEPEEVRSSAIELGEMNLATGSRLLHQHYDQSLLKSAARTRADDVLLYLAMRLFQRRPAYSNLEARLKRDVKAFFGSYAAAQTTATSLLSAAADTEQLNAACCQAASAGLGWLNEGHSLQLHVSLVERLPVLLRAYVACGLLLWGDMSETQLVKIHIGSGKLTLMEFGEFDGVAVPLLRRRIKVNVRRQDYDVFEYGSEAFPLAPLYWKSRYLHEDYPGYAEQLAFDEALARAGVLQELEYGPSLEVLEQRLELRRLRVCGFTLAPSQRIPALDQSCGAHFTFRSFIECGTTQRRSGVSNIPLNPQTYNALFALSEEVLEPVVEYFGAIHLTYGFCSAELGKHITRAVAPKLDQHASFESSRAGRPICDRGGAAVDFLVEDEDMREVADWIIANTPFDRLYFYGNDRPIHVSYSASPAREAYAMKALANGRLMPRTWAKRS